MSLTNKYTTHAICSTSAIDIHILMVKLWQIGSTRIVGITIIDIIIREANR
jgi:hypothetical protein